MQALWRIRWVLKPYLGRILLNLTLILALTGFNLLIPRIIQQVIDLGLKSGSTAFLVRSALILLAIGIATAIMSIFVRYLSESTGARIGFDLRNRMYDHIQHMSFTFHDHAQTGQLISRCIEDVRAIQGFAAQVIIEMLQMILLSVGIIVIMLTDNWRLALIALAPMVPLVWMTIEFGNRLTALFYDVDNALGDVSARLQENVTGAQVVRAFAREPYEIQRFDEVNHDYFQKRVRVVREWSKIMPTTNFLIIAGTILILWFGGNMVLRGEMTVGEVVAFNAYLLLLSGPIGQLTWLVNAGGEATAGAKRALEVLENPPEIQSPAGALELPTLTGAVEFREVALKYQDEKRDSLTEINLQVEPNQIIALIGTTGSGKTSLVNLIPRFYDVSDGAVLVDGHDVRAVNLVSLRRQIGLVLQTSLLFSDSIRENIAFGRPEASMDEIMAAAQAAQAHEFITHLPEGYETIVGERGVTLSGGQRQRVAIARALLMNPRILVLDDSLSSVDTQTEKLIQEALDRLMEGRTTFVIAHRLSTVRRADLIVVMDKGRIVQTGRHEALLAEGGLYKEIHDLQLSQNQPFEDELEDSQPARRTRRAGEHSLS